MVGPKRRRHSTVERIWRIKHTQGQILALAFRSPKYFNLFQLLKLFGFSQCFKLCLARKRRAFGCRVYVGVWVLGFGFWVLGFGFGFLGCGLWVVGVGWKTLRGAASRARTRPRSRPAPRTPLLGPQITPLLWSHKTTPLF